MTELVFDGITKSFLYGFKRQTVLHGLSLEVAKGEIFGFLGPNGAGKSTSINITLDFIRADKGKVLIKDHLSTDPTSRKFIGYMSEHPIYYEQLTPRELLYFAGLSSGMARKPLDQNIKTLLLKLDLLHVLKRPVRTFSKGMKQRMGLALAMIHDPDVLVLDEPMSGLDPLGRRLVTDLILEFKSKGKTIFFSSHILNDVETLCDRIAILHKGHMLFCGDLASFSSQKESLEEVFIRHISDSDLKTKD